MGPRELAVLLVRHGWEPAPGVVWPEDTDDVEYDDPTPPVVVHKRRRRVRQGGPGLFDGAEAAHA